MFRCIKFFTFFEHLLQVSRLLATFCFLFAKLHRLWFSSLISSDWSDWYNQPKLTNIWISKSNKIRIWWWYINFKMYQDHVHNNEYSETFSAFFLHKDCLYHVSHNQQCQWNRKYLWKDAKRELNKGLNGWI